jgi:hypothetical protein
VRTSAPARARTPASGTTPISHRGGSRPQPQPDSRDRAPAPQTDAGTQPPYPYRYQPADGAPASQPVAWQPQPRDASGSADSLACDRDQPVAARVGGGDGGGQVAAVDSSDPGGVGGA